MNNKKRLSQASLIVSIAIFLAVIAVYVPQLSILSIIIPALYAVTGAITDAKYSILSIVITFLILLFTGDTAYALSVCITNAIPGIIVGRAMKICIGKDSEDKLTPIYVGVIAFVVSTILYFFIAQVVLKINLLQEIMKMIEVNIASQISTIKEYQPQLIEGLNSKDLLSYFNNMMPMMLFLQGIVSAFITYHLGGFILKKLKVNIETSRFTEFYLPGNAVMTSFVLYLIVLLIEFTGLNLYTDLIMMNLQLVFSLMFIVQGISVSIYFFRRWLKESRISNILFSGIAIGLFGVMGISFIGMIDSIIDFRKLRSYKSI